jgi:nucleoside-diphosphate-sugar epimerase
MRVFVTGSTGYIGSAIVKELIAAGHEVLGLVRSEESSRKLAAAGGVPFSGTLQDSEGLKKAAAASDGVIHTAFIHDFAHYEASAAVDRRAIEAMGEALEGSGRPLVIASGVAGLSPGRVATEMDRGGSGTNPSPRLATELVVLGMAERGLRSSVVRLAPSVHGEGDLHGFVPTLIKIAREKGVAAYVGDGLNRWPAVHRLDAAALFRLALEKGEAGGVFHAVGDFGIPMKDIAAAIGAGLGLPVVSKSKEEAQGHFGWIGPFVQIDAPVSCELTKERLGWAPLRQGLLEDLRQAFYFEAR